ncbi:MAG TPA: hypothetical protein VGM47_03605 [Gammaproteobacteria bacterium]|jgi:hypothetical protein
MNQQQEDTAFIFPGTVLAMEAIITVMLINAVRDGQDGAEAVQSWKASILKQFDNDYKQGPVAGNRTVKAAHDKAEMIFDNAFRGAAAVKKSGH